MVLAVLAVAAAGIAGWALWRLDRLERSRPITTPTPEPLPDRLELEAVELADLPGWQEDSLSAALSALQRSCDVVDRWTGTEHGEIFGSALSPDRWSSLCARLIELDPSDEDSLRSLLAAELRPYAVSNRGDRDGLFTGYYEPTLNGSRRPTERFRFPLYRRPPELVSVDLGQFLVANFQKILD